MNRKKKQHIVPQLLLKSFSFRDKYPHRLWAFDKQTDDIVTVAVRDAAQKRCFYDVNLDESHFVSIEDGLAEFESSVSPAVNRLRERRTVKGMSPKDRTHISLFVAVQFLRTIQLKKNFELVNQHLSDIGFLPEGENIVKTANLSFLEFIPKHMTSFAQLMVKKEWLLLSPPSGSIYYISDNPVVLQNTMQDDSEFYSSLGIGVQGVEVYLPLTPTLTLLLLCPVVAEKIKRADEKLKALGIPIICPSLESGLPQQITEGDLRRLNALQVLYAERFVYSREEEFSHAKQLTHDNPEYRKSPAGRIT